MLSNVTNVQNQNQTNSINESFHKKIKHDIITRRVKFEKKLTKKRFAKTISKSSILSSTIVITNLSELIEQLECYIDNQCDFNDEITNKFRCISEIVFKIKTFENAKKIINVFKKIAKFCKKIVVIIEN